MLSCSDWDASQTGKRKDQVGPVCKYFNSYRLLLSAFDFDISTLGAKSKHSFEQVSSL